MPELTWQKSTYSGSGQNDCLELAAAPAGTVHIRESDEPAHVLSPSPSELAALLGLVKQGELRLR